ncbi:Deuterolysin metalloprotease family-domain-containing protein [Whalleya microplaca]|nr:Deuterolysin metalloprotease family-domain-containing protein [Whalleya microplaca]
MRYAQILLAAAGLAATIDARAVHGKRASPLEVTLAPGTSGDAAELVATIKNVGPTDLSLLKVGTLLSESLPVKKLLAVDVSGAEVPFKGISASVNYDALQPEHFHLLKASESVDTVISAATVHEFAQSGTYTFRAVGAIPVAATAGSTQLSRTSVEFASNILSLHVDAAVAMAVPLALKVVLDKRTHIQDNCNTTQLAASTAALANCEKLATAAAADAADLSSARFVEYFKTNATATRDTVVARLRAVAKECSTTDGGVSNYWCNDRSSICESEGPLNAYTIWDQAQTIMCPLFYDTLVPLPKVCHKQDQATTTIHEMTHIEDVYSPHTNDWAYSYNESVALTPERALANADNYSLFANAVNLNC